MAGALTRAIVIVNAKGQIKLPKAVRQLLDVQAGGQICYTIEQDGGVFVTRATDDIDPVIASKSLSKTCWLIPKAFRRFPKRG